MPKTYAWVTIRNCVVAIRIFIRKSLDRETTSVPVKSVVTLLRISATLHASNVEIDLEMQLLPSNIYADTLD